jgi:hypothetical protein
MHRFPALWKVEALDGGFKIVHANDQSLAYVYGHADPRLSHVGTMTGRCWGTHSLRWFMASKQNLIRGLCS